jgi:hypothetical protein
MNSILISGVIKPSKAGLNAVTYEVNVYAAQAGKPIVFVRSLTLTVAGYDVLWAKVKQRVVQYFKDPSFEDGVHTQYLDHLIRP